MFSKENKIKSFIFGAKKIIIFAQKTIVMAIITEKYVNPFTDFGFKKLFGEEPNKDILIDFLNCLLPNQTIVDLTYGRVDRIGLSEENRKAVFDIYCQNDRGEQFIVELQKAKQNYFKDRSIFYTTFPIQQQAVPGSDWDFKLQAIYFVGVLDFVFDDKDKDKTVVSEIKLMDTQKHTVFYDKLTFIYLQMPNFNKPESALETRFDKWLYALRFLSKLQNRPKALQERIFEKLFTIAEVAKLNETERYDYEESVRVYRDIKNSIDTAFDEGKMEGEQIGIKKGEKIGIEKGKAEGKAEGFMITALRAIYKNKLDDDEIAELTGLPTTTIVQLRQLVVKYGEQAETHLEEIN